NVNANSDPKAPGVYVGGEKVAALGLRVSKGRTTHGLSLNVDMDLTPFSYINPCGYKGLEITQTQNLGIKEDMATLAAQLQTMLEKQLGKLLETHEAGKSL
ncbi:MAG: octanoyltransferase, partial [Cocleimonas sp.]